MALGLILALGGCGIDRPTASDDPDSSRSLVDEDQAAGQAALQAFLAAMGEPDVTYRVTGRLQVGPVDQDGLAVLDIRTRYDVKGGDYAGAAFLMRRDRDPAVHLDVIFAVLDETAHYVADMADDRAVEAPPPPSLRRPTVLQALTADDLEFIGVGSDGLFEYSVSGWMYGDPIGEWSDLGAVPVEAFPSTSVRSHQTILSLDALGAPRELVTSWSFDAANGLGQTTGTIVEEIEGLGMYVNLDGPVSPFMTTSYDLIVGADADHVVITEPWREVLPAQPDTATLEVRFGEPDEPIMLGIEGAIGFIRSENEDGAVILDRMVELFEVTDVDVGPGEQTLVAYYRPCDGSCRLLDPPGDFCRVDADITPGGSYRLRIEVHAREQATCTLTELG